MAIEVRCGAWNILTKGIGRKLEFGDLFAKRPTKEIEIKDI